MNTSELNVKYEYLPWMQRGLSVFIDEQDTLVVDKWKNTKRPEIHLKTIFNDKNNKTQAEEVITIQLVGPGDVSTINHVVAVKQVVPKPDSKDFQTDYYPFIDFYEEDLPWRYTPATANENKLRPWIAILICKKGEFSVKPNPTGLPILDILKDEDTYKKIFIDPQLTFALAHAEFTNTDLKSAEENGALSQGVNAVLKNNPDSGISRLLGIRPAFSKDNHLEQDGHYTAFLVPAFEVGRLGGLGEKFDQTLVQAPSWEADFETQKRKTRSLEFPVYYSWDFVTHGESFDALARKIYPMDKLQAAQLPAVLKVDVSNMGEGMDYNTLDKRPQRDVLDTTMATYPHGFEPATMKKFPDSSKHCDEVELANRLKELLSQNAALSEINNIYDGDDDPMITPPLYGAKHVLATSLDESQNAQQTPWFPELNLDITHRVAAGLGKKVIQDHQEEFVQRAWEVIEFINAKNQEIRQQVLSSNIRRAVKNKRFNRDKDIYWGTYNLRETDSKTTDNQMVFASPSAISLVVSKLQTSVGLTPDSFLQKIADENIIYFKEHEVVGLMNLEPICRFIGDRYNNLLTLNYGLMASSEMSGNFPDFNDEEAQTLKSLLASNEWKQLLAIPIEDRPEKSDCPILSDVSKLNSKISEYLSAFKINHRAELLLSYGWIDIDSPSSGPNNNGMSALVGIQIVNSMRLIFNTWIEEELTSIVLKNNTPELKILSKVYPLYDKNHYIREQIIKTICIHSHSAYSKDIDRSRALLYSKSIFQRNPSRFAQTIKILDRFLTIKSYGDDTRYAPEFFDYFLGGNIGCSLWGTVDVGFDPELNFLQQGPNNQIDEVNFPNINLVVIPNEAYDVIFDRQSLCSNIGGESGWYFACERLLEKGYFSGYGYYHKATSDTINGIDILRNDYTLSFGIVCGQGRVVGRELSSKEIEDLKNDRYLTQRDWISCEDTWMFNYEDTKKLNDLCLKKLTPTTVFIQADIKNLKKDGLYREYLTPNDWYQKWFDYFGYNPKADETLFNKILEIHRSVSFKKSSSNVVSVTTTAGSPMLRVSSSKRFESISSTKISLLGNVVSTSRINKTQYPLLAYPVYPEPVYYYLKDLSDKYILPGIDNLPLNSITLFHNNPAFEEAFLCGMNTEMGAELLWREYPTDARGSYFRKFWDADNDNLSITDEEYYDILPLDQWTQGKKLGGNHQKGKGESLLIFAIKAELMESYPGTQVYLHKGKFVSMENRKYIVMCDENEAAFERINPELSAWIKPGIYLVGFRVKFDDVKGNIRDNNAGYFLTFKERMGETRFGVSDDGNFEAAVSTAEHAGDVAERLLNKPTLFGKHLCQFN